MNGIIVRGYIHVNQSTTPTSRQLELLRRAGRDQYAIDKRPLCEILNDEIPYARWEKALNVLRRAGYPSLTEAIYGRMT